MPSLVVSYRPSLRTILFFSFAPLLFSQSTVPPTPPLPAQVGSASTPTLYRFFFRHLATLDAQAKDLDSKGRNGNDLRNYYQTILDLTAAEAAFVKQNAATCMTAVQGLDRQAQTITHQIWALYPTGGIPSPTALPPPDPRLPLLTQQREDITNAQIRSLQADLSAKTFQKLDTYIKTQFARQVTSVPVVLHQPAGGPLGATSTGNHQ